MTEEQNAIQTLSENLADTLNENEHLRQRIEQLEASVNRMADVLEDRVTIRDQFAMAALTGLIADDPIIASDVPEAYRYADAMMEARKQ